MAKETLNHYEPRKIISTLGALDEERLYADLNETIKYLREMQNAYPDRNLQLSMNWSGNEELDEDYPELVIMSTRLETFGEAKLRGDAEIQQRHEDAIYETKASAQRKKLAELNLAYKRDIGKIIDEGAL